MGVNLGEHGVFDFVEHDEELSMSFLDGQALHAQPVYERLEAAGFDCYIQNLPFALLARIDSDIMPSWLDEDETEPVPADLCERYDVEYTTDYLNLAGEAVDVRSSPPRLRHTTKLRLQCPRNGADLLAEKPLALSTEKIVDLGIQTDFVFHECKYRTEVFDQLADIHVFLYMSIKDTLGMVLLEAVAAGLQIAVWDVCGSQKPCMIQGSNARPST